MTDQVRANRMAVLEGWRIMAFSLGGPLGNVLSRSFDLISTVVRDGSSDAASISYSLASLKNERDLAKSMDQQRRVFDPLRNMLYGLSESVSTLMESIIEERGGAAALLHVQPLRLQPMQLQQQLHPMQQPLQLLQMQLPLQHQQDETNDASDLPTLRLVKRESEAKEQPSPDIVILEDQPCSSKQGKSTVSSTESPPAEPTQPAPIPRITIRKISEELASINQQAKRDDTTQPQTTPAPAKKKVATESKATRRKSSEALVIRSPAFDRLVADGAADSKEPVAKQMPGRPKTVAALTEERAISTVDEASSSRSSTVAPHPQTMPPHPAKRPRTDDPATMISSNRWKRSCAPSFEGFYNEDEEEAPWANEIMDPVVSVAIEASTEHYDCQECSRAFDSKQGLKRHAFTHKAVHCPSCNKYVAKEKLDAHMAEYHARYSAEL